MYRPCKYYDRWHAFRVNVATSIVIALCAVWVYTGVGAEVIYKSVDRDGNVVYTDHAHAPKPLAAVRVLTDGMGHGRETKAQALNRARSQAENRKETAKQSARVAQRNQEAASQCNAAKEAFYALKQPTLLQSSERPDLVHAEHAAALARESARQNMVLACTD